MVIGLSYSAWKLSVPSMHLVFCRMLCVHNMLSKHTMAWSANQSRYGMVNNILHTGIIMFCSPWGKQKPGRTAPSLRLGACWDGCIGRGWANNSHLPAAGPAFLNGLALHFSSAHLKHSGKEGSTSHLRWGRHAMLWASQQGTVKAEHWKLLFQAEIKSTEVFCKATALGWQCF